MFVRRLVLANFRCYRQLDLTLPCGTVVVVGRNAQGKTSLIEAIYTLATTRSPHAVSDRELVHWDAAQDPLPFSRVLGEIVRGGAATRVEVLNIRQAQDGGDERYTKRTQVDNLPRRALDVVGHLNVVLFSPRDIDVVAGAPAERRRYLDVLLCQVDRAYCRALAQFNQVLSQRNFLLRRLRDRGGRMDELAFWDERLAQHGAAVTARRAAAVVALGERAAAVHAELVDETAPGARLAIVYQPGFASAAALRELAVPTADGGIAENVLADAAALAALYRAITEARRNEDVARGATQLGPHRDELSFTVDGVDMRTFGSRGQQRTVALALRLAEAELMWAETGERPVLLLDDVLSELDPERRRHVLERIDPAQQTLLTLTDTGNVPESFLEQSLVLTVDAARITAAARDGRPVTPPVREPA